MFKNCLVFKMYNACEALLRIIYKFKLLFETFSLPAMFQCLLIFKIHYIYHRQEYTMSRIKFINIILKGLNINPYFQYLINFLFHKYTYIQYKIKQIHIPKKSSLYQNAQKKL